MILFQKIEAAAVLAGLLAAYGCKDTRVKRMLKEQQP